MGLSVFSQYERRSKLVTIKPERFLATHTERIESNRKGLTLMAVHFGCLLKEI